MISLDKFCEYCGSYLIQLVHVKGWQGCSCGARRMDNGIITLSDLITSGGKYPERAQSIELTSELKQNGVKLLNQVNQFLKDIGIKQVIVSSGFRTSEANASLPNSAKRSLHMSCKAIDIADPDGGLATLIENEPDLLRKYGLWLEDPNYTKSWVHLDIGVRSDRPSRTFVP